jgi:uncharacterized protein
MLANVQLLVFTLVPILAAVQSVFGVGLLVFGTPLLLLAGLPFQQILVYLLPCSIIISFLQVADGGLTWEPIRKNFLLYTAPSVFIGTLLILVVIRHSVNIRHIVGTMLMVTAAARLPGRARHVMERFIRGHLTILMVGLGLVHGLSNLGGGILTLIVGSVYRDKSTTRKHIAFGYGMMAIIQLAVVFLTNSAELDIALWMTLPGTAALSYLIVGARIFKLTGEAAYQWCLTALIGVFGLLLFIPA